MFFPEQHLWVHIPHTHVTCRQNALDQKGGMHTQTK